MQAKILDVFNFDPWLRALFFLLSARVLPRCNCPVVDSVTRQEKLISHQNSCHAECFENFEPLPFIGYAQRAIPLGLCVCRVERAAGNVRWQTRSARVIQVPWQQLSPQAPLLNTCDPFGILEIRNVKWNNDVTADADK